MNNIMLGLTNSLTGLLLIAVCVPLAKRKVKMNRWYGMRLPKAFKSEENWYKINAYGGRLFIYWAIPLVLGGIVSLFLPPFGMYQIYFLNLSCLILLIPLVQLFIYSNKI